MNFALIARLTALVLGSATLRDRVRWALVDRNARKGKLPSDHAPLIVDLEDA